MLSVTEALGADGKLERHIEGFSPREQQQAMAEEVAKAIEESQVLVCEAGTGTGKTLAYLAAALLSGAKTIVSTGTKTLQDQLFHRDLPIARDALHAGATIALLKGRSNYLCLHRLNAGSPRDMFSGDDDEQLRLIKAWAAHTRNGDIAEMTAIPEDAPVWRRATSTLDNCLGQDCGWFEQCHVARARRAAQEADILIVNHHLFFADMVLREEGFGELLPGADAVVLDEAHQLPELATRFFGVSLSTNQLSDLARETVAAHELDAGDMPVLESCALTLDRAARALRLAFDTETDRLPWRDAAALPNVAIRAEAIRVALQELREVLQDVATRGQNLEACHRRAQAYGERLDQLCGSGTENHVQWIEVHHRGLTWHLSPLDVGPAFRARMRASDCAWVFTSATLAVGGNFDHFVARLGIEADTCRLWHSPFDFEHQALCYVPERLPEPGDPGYVTAVVEYSRPVLEASGGRAFMLFTSHASLALAGRLLSQTTSCALLVQGTAPRGELLRRFRDTGNAVLLGTSSFWEGVDVRGDALSCVIIDKLPFAAPGDPVLQARIRALRENGENPFRSHQLPQAVIALKQGVGRLIRDATDCGVVVLCDPRLYTRSYGSIFLKSLPPMRRSRDIADVRRFFESGPGA